MVIKSSFIANKEMINIATALNSRRVRGYELEDFQGSLCLNSGGYEERTPVKRSECQAKI